MATAVLTRKPRPKGDVASLVNRYLKTKERAKQLYARSDELLKEIMLQIEPGEAIPLNEDGKFAYLVDKLEGGKKTQAVTIAFFRRFEIEVKKK